MLTVPPKYESGLVMIVDYYCIVDVPLLAPSISSVDIHRLAAYICIVTGAEDSVRFGLQSGRRQPQGGGGRRAQEEGDIIRPRINSLALHQLMPSRGQRGSGKEQPSPPPPSDPSMRGGVGVGEGINCSPDTPSS